MPEVVTTTWLGQIGLSENVHNRLLRTLAFLGLTDEKGRRTAEAERLRNASPEEYRTVLTEIIQRAYHRIFAVLTPEDATNDQKLTHAFWKCEPSAMRDRMQSLFVGLLKEAGLIEGGPVPRSATRGRPTERKLPTNGSDGSRRAPIPPAKPDLRAPAPNGSFVSFSSGAAGPDDSRALQTDLLEAAIRQLPSNRKWTATKRDKWLGAFTAALDFLIEVVEVEPVRRHAIWHGRDGDQDVVVLGQMGITETGREFVRVAGSATGIPMDELTFEDEDF
jgi:hypothetical protein